MKQLLLVLGMLSVLPAAHATRNNEEAEPFSVVIPFLYADEDGGTRLAAELNEYLPEAQHFPAVIEAKTPDKANQQWNELSARFDAINWEVVAPEAPNEDWTTVDYADDLSELTQLHPVPGTRRDVTLCYKGENPEAALQVPGFIAGLADGILSDGFAVSGWKYKRQSELDERYAEEPEAAAEFPALWNEWRGRGEAVLIMSSNFYIDQWNFDGAIVRKCARAR
jgi:hypothetical protein